MPSWFSTSGRCEGARLSAAEVKVAERDLLVLVVDMFTRYSSGRSSENSQWKQLCCSSVARKTQRRRHRLGSSFEPPLRHRLLRFGYSAAARNAQAPKNRAARRQRGRSAERTCLPPSLTRSLITSYEHVRNEPRQGRRSVDRVTARLLAPRSSPSPHLAPHPTDRVTDLRRVRSLTCRPRVHTDSGRVEPA